MVDADKAMFSSELLEHGVIHDKIVTKELRLAYWMSLKDMPASDFKRASEILKKTSKWLPRPAHFTAAAKQGWT